MMEPQITSATPIHRFEFELVDTKLEKDVEVVRERFLTEASCGSRGVNVRGFGVEKVREY